MNLFKLLNVRGLNQLYPQVLQLQRQLLLNVSPGIFINTRSKYDEKRTILQSMPKMDEGTHGEHVVDIDMISSKRRRDEMFPDADTPNKLYDGVRFDELPVCHIKTSKNNTHIHFTDARGESICFRSCGAEGFKNARKGTNIAAQATAISIASIAKAKGLKTIRLKIQGIGPGRMSSVKGLQMAGMEIVCISDVTPITANPSRPPKARRV